jgi:hypothetical protein
MSHLDIRNIPLGDDGEGRKIAIVVQKKMKLDRALRPTELGPIEKRKGQIDNT